MYSASKRKAIESNLANALVTHSKGGKDLYVKIRSNKVDFYHKKPPGKSHYIRHDSLRTYGAQQLANALLQETYPLIEQAERERAKATTKHRASAGSARGKTEFKITNDKGRSFLVHLVTRGHGYGLDNSIIHDEADPLIEFYDLTHVKSPRDRFSHFVSRYYAETLAEIDPGRGINLVGYEPAWSIDGAALRPIVALAKRVAVPHRR